MEERIEDDDGDLMASLSTVPPHRKAYSYSQQLGKGTHGNHKRNNFRNHSLEEERMPKIVDRYYDSSDDDEPFPSSSTKITTTSSSSSSSSNYVFNSITSNNNISIIRDPHDFDNQFLERNPSNGSNEPRRIILQEFVASGGGKGIFKVPLRGPVHPGRPPSLELRPHPLRETQVGSFLRDISCTDDQLWGGEESGLRFWNFSDLYATGSGNGARAKRGDEEAAPFSESVNTSPTLCMIVDPGNKLIWSGHKDGKIRSWKMDHQSSEGNSFKEGLAWHAHRGPVLSMVMTSYGDLWSGSESGVVKVWPWETIEKSLSLSAEERHMAALLVERSYIDLKNQVTVNGVCSISGSDVKYLLSDNFRAKVWSASYTIFALWDARTRELMKVFNIDGQIENRVEMAPVQESSVEDEMRMKIVSTSKKEKSQNFFQRSRNALMGAADAVRRVASKGIGDDNRRTEALVLTIDGTIWTGCSNGLLIQWDGNGNRLQEFHHYPVAIQCFCTLGSRIWVGYASGIIQVLDLEGNLRGEWVAHSSPILSMAIGAGYVFTLANHGGIRGWNITSPSLFDNILRSELANKEMVYTKQENVKILTGTWNVGQGRASHDSLIAWLGSAASEVGIVVVGLQEVEMGTGFLAMSAAKETVGLEGSSIGQWWLDTIGRTLDEGTTFGRVGSRQLAGLLIVL